jgi:hypothetical protein
MSPLFKEVMVWQRMDDQTAVRYSCLEDLENSVFAVQSADFFRLPLCDNALADMSRQFIELLIEVPPLERCLWFASVEEAIYDHQRRFS